MIIVTFNMSMSVYMDCRISTETLRELALPIPGQLEHILTEEATKIALVTPFIRALGYDTTDPTEVVPEFYGGHRFQERGKS